MSLRDTLTRWIAGPTLDALRADLDSTRQSLASISTRVDDSPGWTSLNTYPGDRDYSERLQDIEDGLEAWRKNFFVRRLVNLTHGYSIGNGISITSKDPDVQAFINTFWNHHKNRMPARLTPICDQLTREGELFPILFTNKLDGISYIRFRTARQIQEIETLKNDWEEERAYREVDALGEGKRWYNPSHPAAQKRRTNGSVSPVMLHWTINKPLDALRGEGDLTPILPWAKRYSGWLSDRVRLNRLRTKQAMMDVKLADDALVELKRQQLRTSNPVDAGIYVHGPAEEVTYPSLNIQASDAESDGKALRLAIATGSMTAPHYLAEGGNVNYANAKEMGEPTARFYTERQQTLTKMLENLVFTAYSRFLLVTQNILLPLDEDLQLSAITTEVARADNTALATAAREAASAFAIGFQQGWMDEETALTLTLKFAGEVMSKEEIKEILHQAPPRQAPQVPNYDIPTTN